MMIFGMSKGFQLMSTMAAVSESYRRISTLVPLEGRAVLKAQYYQTAGIVEEVEDTSSINTPSINNSYWQTIMRTAKSFATYTVDNAVDNRKIVHSVANYKHSLATSQLMGADHIDQPGPQSSGSVGNHWSKQHGYRQLRERTTLNKFGAPAAVVIQKNAIEKIASCPNRILYSQGQSNKGVSDKNGFTFEYGVMKGTHVSHSQQSKASYDCRVGKLVDGDTAKKLIAALSLPKTAQAQSTDLHLEYRQSIEVMERRIMAQVAEQAQVIRQELQQLHSYNSPRLLEQHLQPLLDKSIEQSMSRAATSRVRPLNSYDPF